MFYLVLCVFLNEIYDSVKGQTWSGLVFLRREREREREPASQPETERERQPASQPETERETIWFYLVLSCFFNEISGSVKGQTWSGLVLPMKNLTRPASQARQPASQPATARESQPGKQSEREPASHETLW